MEPINIEVTLEEVFEVEVPEGQAGLAFNYNADSYSNADFWFTEEVLEGMLAKLKDIKEKYRALE